jgi:hypothetical protein
MRKLAGDADSCEKELVATTQYDSYTRTGASSCAIAPDFCPAGGTPVAPPTAAYAIPVPFLNSDFAKVRIELTMATRALDAGSLALLVNGTGVPDAALGATVAATETHYYAERAAAEVGWNTWLSGDMVCAPQSKHACAAAVPIC